MRSLLHRLFRPLLAGSAVTMIWLTLGVSAHAASITYTFTGVGQGTVGTVAWSGDFTFVFNADTANITSGGGEFRQDGIGGTFSKPGLFRERSLPTTPWWSTMIPLPRGLVSSTVLSITAGPFRTVR